ncbi:hypothetical protein [Clostridium tyrobutyricum]|uniref:hypothetical protein n=1 Tax=Clostridium tyrobutyricum TaxID=1519 RepID=UPI00057E5082|nr:hypothetical protein [Clostridium tyrobutyricum]MBR9648746.1 hypothetical protein [Clostridium tyrobutyricum]
MDKDVKQQVKKIEHRVVDPEGSVQERLQCALNNVNKFKRKAALAKTKKEKQILLDESQLLEVTINRAMDLLCL